MKWRITIKTATATHRFHGIGDSGELEWFFGGLFEEAYSITTLQVPA
jgi:hypothetical protein